MIYADSESMLAREDNGKRNPDESYTNKQKHVTCIYCYKLVSTEDKFSKVYFKI